MDVRFEARKPYRTLTILVRFVETEEPKDLLRDLRLAGWIEVGPRLQPMRDQLNLKAVLDGEEPAIRFSPPTIEVRLFKPGKGVYQSWNEKDERRNVPQAERIFCRHGLKKVPVKKLDLDDLL